MFCYMLTLSCTKYPTYISVIYLIPKDWAPALRMLLVRHQEKLSFSFFIGKITLKNVLSSKGARVFIPFLNDSTWQAHVSPQEKALNAGYLLEGGLYNSVIIARSCNFASKLNTWLFCLSSPINVHSKGHWLINTTQKHCPGVNLK